MTMRLIAGLLAPIRGQHVVNNVVDSDRAQKAIVLINHRQSDQVVGSKTVGHLRKRGFCAHRFDRGIDDRRDQRGWWFPQEPLKMAHAQVLTGGSLRGRPADEDLRG